MVRDVGSWMVGGPFICDVSNVARVMVSVVLHMLNATVGQEDTGQSVSQM